MTRQNLRQIARRDARTIAATRRAELLERSRRVEGLAVEVMSAIRERDLLVSTAERKAGQALREMTATEGLTLREAVEWCGDSVNLREATRLWKLAGVVGTASPPGARSTAPGKPEES